MAALILKLNVFPKYMFLLRDLLPQHPRIYDTRALLLRDLNIRSRLIFNCTANANSKINSCCTCCNEFIKEIGHYSTRCTSVPSPGIDTNSSLLHLSVVEKLFENAKLTPMDHLNLVFVITTTTALISKLFGCQSYVIRTRGFFGGLASRVTSSDTSDDCCQKYSGCQSNDRLHCER
jgi:hypothetical protein